MFALPDPLHPAVVHLPLALAVLVPAFALLAAWTIHRGIMPLRAWLAVLLLQGILVGSGWIALETGEEQEEFVERVVAEKHIEAHEERAERFQLGAAIALAIIAAGAFPGVVGAVARGVSVVAALAVLVAGIQVGHSGGDLVYRYGAANAYVQQEHPDLLATAVHRSEHDRDDD